MKATLASLSIVLALCGSAGAGDLGGTPLAVDCGTVVTVTDDNAFSTLTLEPSDPIFSKVCANDGITVRNQGKGAIDRGLALDCQGNAGQATAGKSIKGSAKGTGIELQGPNLMVTNC